MKEWIELIELKGLFGMPTTKQGLSYIAKKENWQRRRKEGVKGNVYEYYVGDMSLEVQKALGFEPSQPSAEINKGNVNLIPSNELEKIPFYNAIASAGAGVINSDHQEADDYIAFSPKWLWQNGLHKNKLLFILTHGDSMEPTIRNGDILLVDLNSTTLKDGQIYVLKIDGELLVKRVQRIPNGIRLISDNKELYQPIDVIFNNSCNVETLGRVVFVGRTFA